MPLRIGVLALQGGVGEHVIATAEAAKSLGIGCDVVEARVKNDLGGLSGLIIPGGESTVLQKLCEREGMFDALKGVPAIFGTCAGAIMLAKKVNSREAEQRTLELMDIEMDRNAYGRQVDSFETGIETEFGSIRSVFIRAPRIMKTGNGTRALARFGDDVVACEQEPDGRYYLATTFHPELTTTRFHERFLSRASELAAQS